MSKSWANLEILSLEKPKIDPKSTKIYGWSKKLSKNFFLHFWNLHTSIREKMQKKFFIFFSLYDGLGLRKFYCILLIIARVGIIEINAMIEIIEIIILIEIIEIIILIIDIEIVALNKSMKLNLNRHRAGFFEKIPVRRKMAKNRSKKGFFELFSKTALTISMKLAQNVNWNISEHLAKTACQNLFPFLR